MNLVRSSVMSFVLFVLRSGSGLDRVDRQPNRDSIKSWGFLFGLSLSLSRTAMRVSPDMSRLLTASLLLDFFIVPQHGHGSSRNNFTSSIEY